MTFLFFSVTSRITLFALKNGLLLERLSILHFQVKAGFYHLGTLIRDSLRSNATVYERFLNLDLLPWSDLVDLFTGWVVGRGMQVFVIQSRILFRFFFWTVCQLFSQIDLLDFNRALLRRGDLLCWRWPWLKLERHLLNFLGREVNSALLCRWGLVDWIQIKTLVDVSCVQALLLLMQVQLLQHILEGVHLVLVAFERGRKRFFDVRITDVLQDLHSSVRAFLQESFVHRDSSPLVRLVHLLKVGV